MPDLFQKRVYPDRIINSYCAGWHSRVGEFAGFILHVSEISGLFKGRRGVDIPVFTTQGGFFVQ